MIRNHNRMKRKPRNKKSGNKLQYEQGYSEGMRTVRAWIIRIQLEIRSWVRMETRNTYSVGMHLRVRSFQPRHIRLDRHRVDWEDYLRQLQLRTATLEVSQQEQTTINNNNNNNSMQWIWVSRLRARNKRDHCRTCLSRYILRSTHNSSHNNNNNTDYLLQVIRRTIINWMTYLCNLLGRLHQIRMHYRILGHLSCQIRK